jgi:hypothetical protein
MDGFHAAFSRHEWAGENVLRFLAATRDQSPFFDVLTITNSAGRELPYVYVRSHDLILLFQFASDATVELAVPRGAGYLSITADLSSWAGGLGAARNLSLRPGGSEKIAVEIKRNSIDIVVVPTPRPR